MVFSIIILVILFIIGFMYSSAVARSKMSLSHPLTDEMEREIERRLTESNRYYR